MYTAPGSTGKAAPQDVALAMGLRERKRKQAGIDRNDNADYHLPGPTAGPTADSLCHLKLPRRCVRALFLLLDAHISNSK
jgi:hypothetical protein